MKLNGLKSKFAGENVDFNPESVTGIQFREHLLGNRMIINMGDKTIACDIDLGTSFRAANSDFVKMCPREVPVTITSRAGENIYANDAWHFRNQ